MKTLSTLLIVVGLPLSVKAQAPCLQEYKGEVTLYNKEKGLSKVSIVIDGNQGPFTDANGIFRYRLSKCPGMAVQIRLGSDTWAIVNHADIYSYTLRKLADPADFQFKVIVAQAKEIEKARIDYYTRVLGIALDKYGVELNKGLSALSGRVDKLIVADQKLNTTLSRATDQQPERKVGELENRLEQQQKEYQRALDSLVKEPASLMNKLDELQGLLVKQRLDNKRLLDSLAKGSAQQQGSVEELKKILGQQQQKHQQLLATLALQDSTRQTDRTNRLVTILEQQKRENQLLRDSLAIKERAWQKNQANGAPDTAVQPSELNRLRDSLKVMQAQYELALSERNNRLRETKAIATVFAQQTEIDSSYQQAFVQYKEGQFQGALLALSDDQPDKDKQASAPKSIVSKSPDEALRERAVYISKCLFRANIYRSQYNMAQASHWYEEAIRTDSTQVGNLLTYANFLHMQNLPNVPEQWYRKALDLTPPAPLQVDIYMDLATYYIDNNQYDEAETALVEARSIKQKLTRTNAEQYDPGLARLLDGFGLLYTQKRQYDEAEKAYVQAKNIREKLVEKYADEFEGDLAFSLNNLGTFYHTNKRYGEAGKTYLRAKTVQDRLVRRNAEQYEPDLASTLGNLGTLNVELARLSDAETVYKQAKSIREKLAVKNPDLYEPGLAQVLNDLGDVYALSRRYPDAEASYQQAKTIREKLAQKNPDQFNPGLAQTLSDLGLLYVDTKRYPEAETVYGRARAIQEKLAVKYPKLFEAGLAVTLADLGYFYTEMKRNPEAEVAYEQAKTILEKLVKKNPMAYKSDLAYTLTDLGNFYVDTQRQREAKGAYIQAKELMETLAPTDGGQLGSLLIQLVHRIGILSDYQERERYFQEADSLQEQAVELAGKQFGEADSSMMARELSNWSYHLLFNKKFAKAEAMAEKALSFDERESWVNANLAAAYLMQGKLEQAKDLYTYLKNKPHRSGRYKKTFLADLDELEEAGITHPDIAVIRKLLNQ